MSQEQLRSEHAAWFWSGFLALSVHLLVLCSEANSTPKQAARVSGAGRWERETWELLVPVSDQPEPAREREPESHDPQTRARRVRTTRLALKSADIAPHLSLADAAAWPHDPMPALQAAKWARPRSRATRSLGVFAATVHAQYSHCDRACERFDAADSGDSSSRGLLADTDATAKTTPRASSLPVRAPRLLTKKNLCAGYFPAAATVAHGQVELMIEVDAQGAAHAGEVLFELPRGQGFESAAKACASHLRFAPALDRQGGPVGGHARIGLHFERR